MEQTRFHRQNFSREITERLSKGEHPYLHVTHCLDVIYIPTKYNQNI